MKCFMQMFMMQCESEHKERHLQAAQAKMTQDIHGAPTFLVPK